MGRSIVFDFIARDRKYTGPLRQMEGSTVRFGATLGRVSGVAVRAFGGVGVAAVGLGIAGATMGIKTAAGLEQANIAFTKLLGSGKAAQKFLTDLKKFAAATPFELPGLIDNARGLLGVGVEAKKVIPILTDLGDAAGALGLDQERFNRVQLAVTQSMAKGKIQAEELMQITEAGIPVWQLLSRALGKPVPELQKLVSQGKLAAADVFPKLFDQMHKDYGGSMAKQSRTLTGLWSTFMDTLNLGLADVIKPLEGELKGGLKDAIGIAQGALKGAADFITGTVVPSLQTAKKWWTDNKDIVSDFAGILKTVFSPAASDAKTSTDDLRTSQEKLYDAFSSGLEAGLRLAQGFIALARLAGNVSKVFIDLVGGAGHLVNAVDRLSGGSGRAGNAMIAWARDMREKTLVQLGKLEQQAKETQAAIDRLRGRRVDIQARLKLGFTSSFTQKDWVQVRVAAGRMAAGGLVRGPGGPTADMVPALLSSGEFVVNAAAVRQLGVQNMKRLNAIRFASGGPVGMIDTETGAINRVQAWGTGRRMDRGLTRLLAAGAGGPMPASRNEAIVRQVAASIFGWIGSQWNALRSLLMGESGFRNTAQNPTSSAYGIYQFLSGTWGTVGGHKTSDPRLQAIYGDRYIRSRYGDPIGAYSAWLSRSPHWYDQGGLLPPGMSIAVNRTGRPEPVGFDYDKMARAFVKALREQPPRVAVDDVHAGFLAKKTRLGGMSLGLS